MNNDLMFSSDKQDWQTPEIVLDLVREVGLISLDPCTSLDNPVNAAHFYTEKEDGLIQPWDTDGVIFVNPPYSDIPKWAEKCAKEGINNEIIALVPARTDTRWWHYNIIKADAICFWAGRLKFKGAPNAAPFPSALSYWGDRKDKFIQVFKKFGWCITL